MFFDTAFSQIAIAAGIGASQNVLTVVLIYQGPISLVLNRDCDIMCFTALPTELFLVILHLVDHKDLGSVRATSQSLSDIVTPVFWGKLTLQGTRASIQKYSKLLEFSWPIVENIGSLNWNPLAYSDPYSESPKIKFADQWKLIGRFPNIEHLTISGSQFTQYPVEAEVLAFERHLIYARPRVTSFELNDVAYKIDWSTHKIENMTFTGVAGAKREVALKLLSPSMIINAAIPFDAPVLGRVKFLSCHWMPQSIGFIGVRINVDIMSRMLLYTKQGIQRLALHDAELYNEVSSESPKTYGNICPILQLLLLFNHYVGEHDPPRVSLLRVKKAHWEGEVSIPESDMAVYLSMPAKNRLSWWEQHVPHFYLQARMRHALASQVAFSLEHESFSCSLGKLASYSMETFGGEEACSESFTPIIVRQERAPNDPSLWLA